MGISKRAKAIAGGVGGVVIAGGAALAAILLTTTIAGNATVNEVETSNSLNVSASAANGSRLNCSDIKVSDDFKTLTFNPVLTKPVGGTNADPATVPVPGGDCTVTLKVKNTGDTTIKVDGTSNLSSFPKGWQPSGFSGNALSPIAPGAEGSLVIKVTATQAAEAGAITGKLVYTDAA